MVFESLSDSAFGFCVEVFVGGAKPLDFLGLLVLLILDALYFGKSFGIFGFGDGFGFAFFLDECLLFGFAGSFELFVFLLVVGGNSRHC